MTSGTKRRTRMEFPMDKHGRRERKPRTSAVKIMTSENPGSQLILALAGFPGYRALLGAVSAVVTMEFTA